MESPAFIKCLKLISIFEKLIAHNIPSNHELTLLPLPEDFLETLFNLSDQIVDDYFEIQSNIEKIKTSDAICKLVDDLTERTIDPFFVGKENTGNKTLDSNLANLRLLIINLLVAVSDRYKFGEIR